MLAIPIKKGKVADLVAPLQRYITQEYSAAAAAENLSDCRSIEALRNSCAAISEASEGNIETLRRFREQQHFLGPRMPNLCSEVMFAFSWCDAFVTSKSAQNSCLPFDQVAILFNLGAIESAVGASEERKSDEGLKKASKRFQTAAGYFDAARAVSVTGTITPDISSTGLMMVMRPQT